MAQQNIDQEELEVFMEEVGELLQILEEDIIKLEKQPDNPSVLQEIFRSAHTLKGSSAAMGFNVLSRLSHSMESVFDGVRSGRIQVSMPLIDAFLHCTDTIKNLRDEIASGLEEKTDININLEALKMLMGGGDAGKAAERPPEILRKQRETAPVASEVTEEKKRTLCIVFKAEPACNMPYVRALQILTFLSETGEIVDSTPALEQIDNEEGPAFPLTVILRTVHGEDKVRETISPVSGVKLVGMEESDASGVVQKIASGDGQLDESAADLDKECRDEEDSEDEKDSESEEYSDDEKGLEDTELKADTVRLRTSEDTKPAPAATTESDNHKKKYTSRTVRVDVERMDAIMDLVGELVINRTRLTQLCRNMEVFLGSEEDVGNMNETADNIELISSQLQENIMKARLLPVENVFNKFPRMVRDLARKSEKKIELLIEGEKTELDRTVIEEIGDPLMHTIRNSIDHGIEREEDRIKSGKPPAGKVRISASNVEDHIQIIVEDDGRGIDLVKVAEKAKTMNLVPRENLESMKEDEILELIFAPGFSTAEKVSEVSGRGVGMDVVRTNIEKLNGNISIISLPGKGTKTIIKLPLTLAIVKALLVTLENRIFAIPLVSVVRTLRVEMDEIHTVKGMETIIFHQSVLPIVSLEEVFRIRRSAQRPRKFFIVVISWGGKRVGIKVDSLIGDQEIVIRPLGEYIGEVPGVSGAAILGDGRISLIIDIDGFIRLRRKEVESVRASGG